MDQIGWGYERAMAAGIDFALTDISCKYRSMTRFGETVAIHMTVTKLSPAKMKVVYRMVDAETGVLRAEGTSGHFFYDRKNNKPVALKRVLPEAYELFERLLREHAES